MRRESGCEARGKGELQDRGANAWGHFKNTPPLDTPPLARTTTVTFAEGPDARHNLINTHKKARNCSDQVKVMFDARSARRVSTGRMLLSD